MKEGHIVYISKDDARLLEFGVFNPSSVEDDYRTDIETMTKFLKGDITPPKEKPIVFSEDFNKFSANFKVGYSQYLTKLYGLKNQHEFDSKYKPTVEKWNRVIGRIKDEKDMTDKNKDILTDIREQGFDIDRIIEKVKGAV